MVPSGLIAACLRAGSPTSLSPSFVKATNEGKAFPEETPAPSAEGRMTGRPPSMTAAAEFDVPKSIPMTLAMMSLLPYAVLHRPSDRLRSTQTYDENPGLFGGSLRAR